MLTSPNQAIDQRQEHDLRSVNGAWSSPALAPLSLHIGIEYGMGGEGRIVSELMRCLPQAGFDFKGLVAGPRNVAELTDGRVHGFAADEKLMTRMIGARRSIREALITLKPAVVASHFALYTAPALDLLRHSRNVSHFHGPWSAESLQEGEGHLSASVKAWIEGAVYRRADRVIVLSMAFSDLGAEDPSELLRTVSRWGPRLCRHRTFRGRSDPGGVSNAPWAPTRSANSGLRSSTGATYGTAYPH